MQVAGVAVLEVTFKRGCFAEGVTDLRWAPRMVMSCGACLASCHYNSTRSLALVSGIQHIRGIYEQGIGPAAENVVMKHDCRGNWATEGKCTTCVFSCSHHDQPTYLPLAVSNSANG